MGKFSNGFWGRLGRNTADLGSNVLFGDKWARPVKHIRGGSAREVRERNIDFDDDIEEDKYVNSVDRAVIENIDTVIDENFSESTPMLVRQIANLLVQVNANSFKARTKEERVRTKYTIAVLSKIQQGIQILEHQDPMNPHLNYLTWQYLKAKWRKIFSLRIALKSSTAGLRWGVWMLAGLFALIGLMSSIETNGAEDTFEGILMGILIILLIIVIGIVLKYIILVLALSAHKYIRKKRAEHMTAINQMVDTSTSVADVIVVKDSEETNKQKNTNESVQFQTMTELYNAYKDSNFILNRGLSFCSNNEQRDILIVGYNPQDITTKDKIYQYDIPKSRYGYWSGVNRLISGMGKDNSEITAYIDLFSYREINQERGIKEIVANPQLIGYVVEQIIATQSVIEDIIKPKLIFIKNQAAWAFFGKLKEFTWMGYNLSPIGNINGFEMCEIVGFTNAKDRVAQDFRATTNLIGTKVIFANEIDLNKYPTPQELSELL